MRASAARVGDRQADYSKRRGAEWQKTALDYIDIVPEINYASRFYSRMLSQVILYPAILETNGQLTRIEQGLPVDLLNRIQDPGGGRGMILSNYGRLMFTTGEGVLFGRNLDTDQERWNFFWKDEVKVEDDGRGGVVAYVHQPTGTASPSDKRYGPQEAVVYPMWTPHPRRSGEPDAPMRAVLSIAEELIVLSDAVMATATTRLTNGILLMPQELSPGAAEPQGDEDVLSDPLAEDIATVFATQIEHPRDAAAKVPPIIWGQSDYIEKARHLPIHDPQNDYLERELRKEAIQRLALGLDMPPEALQGLGSTNHWAAMQILGDMWKSHGLPRALQFASDLAEVYLRPALADEEFPDWQNVVIGVDGSQVVVKPDRADDAIKSFDRRITSRKGARELLNIPERMAATEDELAELDKSPDSAPPQDGADPAADGPDQPGPEGDSGRQTRMTADARITDGTAEVLGAAKLAVVRLREAAGAKLRARKDSCRDCLEPHADTPNAELPAALGIATLEQLGASDTLRLVEGGAGSFHAFLRHEGYAEKHATALVNMLEVHTARTIFEKNPTTLPAGFVNYVRKLEGPDAVEREKEG